MPIYEYACTACGERTEVKQGFNDPPLEVCLICGGKLRKLFSPVGVVFKGSGFYSTDARKQGESKDKKPAEPSSGKGDAKTKGDAKPKTKSEPAGSTGSKDN
jgi:putative FmdB family regulatory protein